jgi:hypothetical protein
MLFEQIMLQQSAACAQKPPSGTQAPLPVEGPAEELAGPPQLQAGDAAASITHVASHIVMQQ